MFTKTGTFRSSPLVLLFLLTLCWNCQPTSNSPDSHFNSQGQESNDNLQSERTNGPSPSPTSIKEVDTVTDLDASNGTVSKIDENDFSGSDGMDNTMLDASAAETSNIGDVLIQTDAAIDAETDITRNECFFDVQASFQATRKYPSACTELTRKTPSDLNSVTVTEELIAHVYDDSDRLIKTSLCLEGKHPQVLFIFLR